MGVGDGRNMKGLKSQKNHYAGKCTYSEMSFSSEIEGLPNTCKEWIKGVCAELELMELKLCSSEDTRLLATMNCIKITVPCHLI